ncbi:hypothetical protein [Rivularia sp. UHCC 0363]|uniref:hypothetical protein n=1 Tax=Rivularia sp. UHCC 0363 TaxID=3110244 RepID=UPI002B1FE60D|nr:hypothetical protein [Rivularia sp. UHCC 0363]MEA5593810.1 hypothetical protein [Rivularia sp. UHCC 0363]
MDCKGISGLDRDELVDVSDLSDRYIAKQKPSFQIKTRFKRDRCTAAAIALHY